MKEEKDKYERSRDNIALLSKYEIEFLGKFKDGMKWSNETLIQPVDGNYHIVDKSKNSIHLVPEGGTMWEKFSVPKNKMKVIRRIK